MMMCKKGKKYRVNKTHWIFDSSIEELLDSYPQNEVFKKGEIVISLEDDNCPFCVPAHLYEEGKFDYYEYSKLKQYYIWATHSSLLDEIEGEHYGN